MLTIWNSSTYRRQPLRSSQTVRLFCCRNAAFFPRVSIFAPVQPVFALWITLVHYRWLLLEARERKKEKQDTDSDESFVQLNLPPVVAAVSSSRKKEKRHNSDESFLSAPPPVVADDRTLLAVCFVITSQWLGWVQQVEHRPLVIKPVRARCVLRLQSPLCAACSVPVCSVSDRSCPFSTDVASLVMSIVPSREPRGSAG